jgi:pyruvate,water dikinase
MPNINKGGEMTWAIAANVLDDEDIEAHPAWFLAVKYLPAGGPMASAEFRHVGWGFCYGTETLSIPTTKGVPWHWKDDVPYITVIPITDEEEIKKREVKFRQAIVPIIERYDELWNAHKAEVMGLYKPLKELDVEKASDMELLDAFAEADHVNGKTWHIHFWWMYGLYSVYMLFEDVCTELFGIDDTSPTFQILVSGFDNKLFEGDAWLWRLSQRASELGLGDLFQTMPATEVAPRLKESAAGGKWLEELGEYLDEFGWKLKDVWHWMSPSWREDLSLPIEKIQTYMRTPEFNLPDVRRAVAEERERTAKELISRVPEDKREWFSLLLAAAQHAGSWSEEHNFYLEFYVDAIIRRILLEMGRRFVAAGTFDQRDDIFLLGTQEVEKVAVCPELYNLRHIVNPRRAALEEHLKPDYVHPPLISKTMNMEEAFGWMATARDPMFEKVMLGRFPTPKPELKADFVGVSGAPGVVEGAARVLFSATDLDQVQAGDILVCPCTSASWSFVFPLLKGLVVNMGGSMSHPAIVSREYGIPCVLNTFVATEKIRTGDRIKVDGTEGVVYILG